MNAQTDGVNGPRARIFDVGNEEPILLGGSPLPDSLVVEWPRFFFDGQDPPPLVNIARITDMLYSRPIMRLPIEEAGTPAEVVEVQCDDTECTDTCDGDSCVVVDDILVRGEVTASLAVLDLVRGQTHSLPGGIQMATCVKEELGATEITVYGIDDLSDGNVFGLPEDYSSTEDVPLLLYLAHESINEQEGRLLGKLGSRIVAETLFGTVEKSPFSILKRGQYDYQSAITGTHSVSMEDVLHYIGWWPEE